MSRWMHALAELDTECRRAVCSICGPTPIYIMPNGDPVCLNYQMQSEAERYERSRVKLVIEKMGGKCEFCGFDDWRALQVDHKGGTGGKRKSAHIIYTEILNGQIDDYQLLCANCNAIKASYRNERSYCYDPVRFR